MTILVATLVPTNQDKILAGNLPKLCCFSIAAEFTQERWMSIAFTACKKFTLAISGISNINTLKDRRVRLCDSNIHNNEWFSLNLDREPSEPLIIDSNRRG